MSENARWISYMKSGSARREAIDRNLLKERQKDDAMYEGKEKFVTAAYKRKLEADRKWLDEVRERELKGRSNKSSFLTRMIDSRADEAGDGKVSESTKGAPTTTPSKEAASPSNPSSHTEKALPTEEEDEFDGFIMAPEEDQIKGNVDSDDAGLIMAPRESRRSRSRSRSRSRHHHHHRHHHHCCVFNKHTRVQITFSHRS